MCGTSGFLLRAKVESVEMQVCKECAKYGTIEKKTHSSVKFKTQRQEKTFKIVKDFGARIRQAREAKDMNQETFSQFLNEKQSILAKWESGSLRPRIDVARELEKKLHINLVIEDTISLADLPSNKKSEPTLGDFVTIRTRKK